MATIILSPIEAKIPEESFNLDMSIREYCGMVSSLKK